jgi:tRNA A58 N-methylase Trm61
MRVLRDEDERGRVRYLEAWADPLTIRHLEEIDVGVGWRCAEVGAGAGSVARWLADRVGPLGSVVATDIDLRFLTDLPANVEVRRQDISKEDLEPEIDDLVHCRVLLLAFGAPA